MIIAISRLESQWIIMGCSDHEEEIPTDVRYTFVKILKNVGNNLEKKLFLKKMIEKT